MQFGSFFILFLADQKEVSENFGSV